MTNVTFLPWVNPEENQPVASPVNAGEATANSHDVPEGVSRLSAITRELRQRGISTALISAAVESIDDDDELHKATELALQRVRQFSRLDDVTAERRLVGFLSRRGYSGDIVRAACKEALSSRS